MKKALLSVIAIMLGLILCLSFSACNKEDASSSSSRRAPSKSSSNTSSVLLKSNKVEIIGNTVVHTNYYYGDNTVIVFTYKNDQLDSAFFTRECKDSQSAQTAYEIFTNLNKHASRPMYEDIKLDGLTLTFKYTDFTLQNYTGHTLEGLKLLLESESLEP